MTFQVTVRTGDIRDLPRIAEIRSDAYRVRGYCSQTRAEQYLKRNNQFALVAETDNKIVGTLLVTYDDAWLLRIKGALPADEVFPIEVGNIRRQYGRLAYYGGLAVEPGKWRTGRLSIGLALIREAIRRAGVDGIEAAVIIVNPRHVSFYETLGFKSLAQCDEVPGLAIDESGKIPGVLMWACSEQLAWPTEFHRATPRVERAHINTMSA